MADKKQIARARLDPLTSIRAYAIIWIFILHYKLHLEPEHFYGLHWYVVEVIRYTYIALDTFFILSGFIISYVYWQKFYDFKSSRENASTFLLARVARIYPLHVFILLVVAIGLFFGVGLIGDNSTSLEDLFYNIILVHGWGVRGMHPMSWNVPSWSVSMEWFFYLLYPLMAPLILRIEKPLHNLIVIGFILVGIYFMIDGRNLLDDRNELYYAWWNSIPRGLSDFIIGMCLLNLYRQDFLKKLNWDIICGLSLVAIFGFIALKTHEIAPLMVLPIFIYSLTHISGYMTKIFCNKPAIAVGEASYSLYLWHIPMISLFAHFYSKYMGGEQGYVPFGLPGLAFFAFVILTALLSNHFIEKPCRIYLKNKILKRAEKVKTVPSTLSKIDPAYFFAAVFVIVSVVTQLRGHISSDLAWHLHVAQKILDGKILYKDLFDSNTPFVFYLATIPVMLSKISNISLELCYRFFDLSQALLYAVLAVKVFKRTPLNDDIVFRNIFIPTIFFIIFVMPICLWFNEFMNKDVAVLAMILPYLLSLLVKDGEYKKNSKLRLLVGVVAGLGFCIKPHYLLAFVVAEFFLFMTDRKNYTWKRPEYLVITYLQLFYTFFILFVTPEYISHVLPIIFATYPLSLKSGFFVFGMAQRFYFPYVVIIVLTLFAMANKCTFKKLFAAMIVVFSIIAIIQNEWWTYQMYPAIAMSILLLPKLCIDFVRSSFKEPRSAFYTVKYYAVTSLTLLTIYYCAAVYQTMYYSLNNTDHLSEIYDLEALNSVIDQHPKKKPSIMVLSEHIYHSQPFLMYSEADNDFSLSSLFPVTAIKNLKTNYADMPEEWIKDKTKFVGSFLLDEIVANLKNNKPDIVVVRYRHAHNFIFGNIFDGTDYIKFLEDLSDELGDTRFSKQWSSYSETAITPHSKNNVYFRIASKQKPDN